MRDYLLQLKTGSVAQGDGCSRRESSDSAAKDLSERHVLKASSAASSRVLGTVVGVGLEFLNPEAATSIGLDRLRTGARKLYEKGVIDEMEWAESQQRLSQGKYKEMQGKLYEAVERYRQSH